MWARTKLAEDLIRMDSLITVIFFIIVAIASAFLKKRQPDAGQEDSWSDGTSPSPPSERGSAPPARRETWEDELRRLLEGKTAPEPSASPPPPPPPLPVSRPKPPPPVIIPEPSSVPTRSVKEPTTDYARKLREKKEAVSSRLQKSMEHLRRASQLDDRAAMTIRRAADRIHHHVKETKVEVKSPEITHALAWMKSPETLRSAMIASIILGPPKSAEFETGKTS